MQPIFFSVLVSACAAAGQLAAKNAAVIVNSGSTNTAGFRIVVERSGKASYTQMARRSGMPSGAQAAPASRAVPSELVKRFYDHLGAAKPLTALPNQGCMKSASFGTTLTIEFGGEKTPDL